MKTLAIHWESTINESIGTGKKLFEKQEAQRLATEFNESYPDIHHEAAIPVTVPPATESAAAKSAKVQCIWGGKSRRQPCNLSML